MTELNEEAGLEGSAGKAMGVKANRKKGVNYADNAEYGETSQQQSTKAKIDTLGGVKEATAFDVASSSAKSAKDKGALSGEIAQHMEKSGVSKEDAKKISEAIIEGSEKGAKEFAKALSSMQSMSSTLSAGNAIKDLTTTGTMGNDGYIEGQRKTGAEAAAKIGVQYDNTKTSLGAANKETDEKSVSNEMHRENRQIDGLKTLPAKLGSHLTRGVEGLTGMAESLFGRDFDGNGKVGEASFGDDHNTEIGVAATAVAASELLGMGKGGGLVTRSVKGTVNLADKAKSAFSPTSGSDNAPDKTNSTKDSHNNNNPSDGTEKSKKPIHDKTPHITNLAGQPTSSHPSNSKSISNISKRSKLGAILGVGAALYAYGEDAVEAAGNLYDSVTGANGQVPENTFSDKFKEAFTSMANASFGPKGGGGQVPGGSQYISNSTSQALRNEQFSGQLAGVAEAGITFAQGAGALFTPTELGANSTLNHAAPQHAGFASQPMGYNTMSAMPDVSTITSSSAASFAMSGSGTEENRSNVALTTRSSESSLVAVNSGTEKTQQSLEFLAKLIDLKEGGSYFSKAPQPAQTSL